MAIELTATLVTERWPRTRPNASRQTRSSAERRLPAGTRRATVIGAGSFGTAIAVLLARAGVRATLQTRTLEQAALLTETRENAKYLPGVELPAALRIEPAANGIARTDFVFLAVPSIALARRDRHASGGQSRPARGGSVAREGARAAGRHRGDDDPAGALRRPPDGVHRWAGARPGDGRSRRGSSPRRPTRSSPKRWPRSSRAPAWSVKCRAIRSASSWRGWPRTPPRWRPARPCTGPKRRGRRRRHIFAEVWRYAAATAPGPSR